jgi:hypothetical protein
VLNLQNGANTDVARVPLFTSFQDRLLCDLRGWMELFPVDELSRAADYPCRQMRVTKFATVECTDRKPVIDLIDSGSRHVPADKNREGSIKQLVP